MYQSKALSIKLKQESGGAGKDPVLASAKFDIARFVGKEGVIYELNLDNP
jgi:hypothetical protein